MLSGKLPVLCVVVYGPPNQRKAFLSEFSELLSVSSYLTLMSRYDRLSILGDFNIHLCCPTNALSTDLLHLIDSSNLVQSVTCPTHVKNLNLDLVLSFGLSLSNFVLCDICLSDPRAVLFDTVFPLSIPKLPAPTRSRIINSTTPSLFSSAYRADSTVPVIESSSTLLN